MRIPEFVEAIATRFDSKLQTDAQISAFQDDCKIHIKKFEGEILGFAFHEIVYRRKFGSHPKIAEIVKICNEKQHKEHKATNPVSKEAEQWRANKKMADEYRSSDQFAWAAKNMIATDVLYYIQKFGKIPDKAFVEKSLKAHAILKKDLDAMKNDMDISAMRLAIYKAGKELYEKNLYHFNQFT